MENEYIEKTPFYKKKALVIPVIALMLLGLVFATVQYFHTTQVDLVVNEARVSGDMPFTLTCNSGETVTKDLTIDNFANVQLCARLDYTETNNTGGVTYTNDLPMDIILAAGSPPTPTTTTTTISFTCDELTEAGSVTGVIGYEKIACV